MRNVHMKPVDYDIAFTFTHGCFSTKMKSLILETFDYPTTSPDSNLFLQPMTHKEMSEFKGMRVGFINNPILVAHELWWGALEREDIVLMDHCGTRKSTFSLFVELLEILKLNNALHELNVVTQTSQLMLNGAKTYDLLVNVKSDEEFKPTWKELETFIETRFNKELSFFSVYFTSRCGLETWKGQLDHSLNNEQRRFIELIYAEDFKVFGKDTLG